jgi:hypothetical protein
LLGILEARSGRVTTQLMHIHVSSSPNWYIHKLNADLELAAALLLLQQWQQQSC